MGHFQSTTDIWYPKCPDTYTRPTPLNCLQVGPYLPNHSMWDLTCPTTDKWNPPCPSTFMWAPNQLNFICGTLPAQLSNWGPFLAQLLTSGTLSATTYLDLPKNSHVAPWLHNYLSEGPGLLHCLLWDSSLSTTLRWDLTCLSGRNIFKETGNFSRTERTEFLVERGLLRVELHPNPQYLIMWPYLEIMSLQISKI